MWAAFNVGTPCLVRALLENGDRSWAGSFQANSEDSVFEATCLLEERHPEGECLVNYSTEPTD